MSYRIRFTADGFEVLTDTVEEAKAILLAGNNVNPAAHRAEVPASPAGFRMTSRPDASRPARPSHGWVSGSGYIRDYRKALTCLAYLHKTAPMVRSTVLARELHLGSPRGLGGFAKVIRGVCAEIGLKSADVYASGSNGKHTFWMPGPKIQEAIAAIEQKAREKGQ